MDVVVLDGSDVPHPEDVAMLQSLYSRSPQSVTSHLEKVKRVGAGKFMERYYVGYGHKSIGDCGTVTVFAEDVSMLAAKAIQDTPLYNGQEASTRYLDFEHRPMVNPLGTAEGAEILDDWRNLYKTVLAHLVPHLSHRFPRSNGQKESVWSSAINAKAFDIARGFLPAGCTTYVSWHTNLRQASDHLALLKHNPCSEVRTVANEIDRALTQRYPSSFTRKQNELNQAYLGNSAARFAFTTSSPPIGPLDTDTSQFDMLGVSEHADLLASRPPRTELHPRMRQYGNIVFRFMLDFGSYRDLQRHRSCVQEMPLLTTNYGIHPWYLEQLPEILRDNLLNTTASLESRIRALPVSDSDRQYYIAMGYQSPIRITCTLPSAVYIAELRSGATVHPTLRSVAQDIGAALRSLLPQMALHCDTSASDWQDWSNRRGNQTIHEK